MAHPAFALAALATLGTGLGIAWYRMHRSEAAFATREALAALGVSTRRRWYRLGLLAEGSLAGGRLQVLRDFDDTRGRLFARLRPRREPDVRLVLTTDAAAGLRLRRVGASWVQRLHWGRPEPTGDLLFDQRWAAYGPTERILALLGDAVRAAVLAVDDPSLILTDGALRLTLPDAACTPEQLKRSLKALAALREALTAAATPPVDRQLEYRAAHDPEPAVRAACFTCLAAQSPTPDRLAMLRQLAPRFATDTAAAVHLLAAQHLGEAALDALARLSADPSTPSELRADAWRRLVASHPDPAALAPSFWQLWPAAQGPLREALLADSPRMRVTLDLAQLEAAAADPDPAARARAATALGRTDARATPILLGLLSGPLAVAEEAASALGQVGDDRALAPLEALAKSLVAPIPLRHVAEVAARRISRRLAEAARQRGLGRLSRVDAEAGGLALAEEGGLALAERRPAKGEPAP